jgi:cell division septation protein DedD
MRNSSRATALALGIAFTLTACGGQSASQLPAAISDSLNRQAGPASPESAARATTTLAPLISIPRTVGPLAYVDSGRRAPNASVGISLTLQYNHQAELDRFVANVSNPHAGPHRNFLSPAEFNATYAPTAQQEESVVRALQSGGFTITKRFSNRTIVDATAPSATVERFFSTEMHTVQQGKYGERYANLKTAVVPAAIAAFVRDASLSNLVVARTKVDEDGVAAGRTRPTPQYDAAGRERIALSKSDVVPLDSTGALVNGGFESGALSPGWINESSTRANDVSVTTAQAYNSTYSAFMGKLKTPEVNGWASIAQSVVVPTNGVLSFWVYQGSNEGTLGYGTTYAYQAGYLLDSSGDVLDTFYKTVNNTNGWANYTINLSAYAGQTDYIYFGCYGDGYSKTYTYQYVDDVAWTGTATPTPKPTATPTAKPTSTPTAKPTSTPTAKPTPTVAPTATAKPSATPTAKPSATPTAMPTTGSCNGAAADNGPLSNSDGTLATGVAKPFDYPVEHGCNGAGYTAAIAIDDPANTSYLAKYLSASAVTQTGTVTNEAVDGGGSGDDPETDLDVQTISGLAPGANIIVYDMGSLTDQAIEDTYNQVLTDGKAAAVNSSFGGCESSDTAFEDSTNSIAEQGAAEGVEFSASAGDTGSDECGSDNTKGVSAPAGDPYFTSIGGVNFTYNTSGVLQTVTAGDTKCSGGVNGVCYGGGGVSTVVALPSWQSGIAGVITSGRNQPDISLPFDPVAVYTGGAFADYLGTSWSSPASVALFIEADELHGSKQGWLNPTLYSLFSSTGYSDYYTPCTSGNNIAYSCNASQYNQAAGIGTPKGWALANAL